MAPDLCFLKQALEDAGCDDRLINECIKIAETQQSTKLLKPLSRHRAVLLDSLHECQRRIDCLDYLLCRIRKNTF